MIEKLETNMKTDVSKDIDLLISMQIVQMNYKNASK